MPRRFNERYASATFKDALNARVWDGIISDLDARIASNEEIRADLEIAIEQLRAVALDRINVVLTPAIESVLRLVEKGFLVASSATSLSLDIGDIVTFVIPAGDERDLFTPSPLVMVTRDGDAAWHAVINRLGYDAEHGELLGQVVSRSGAAGPFDDWQLSAVAGSVVATLDALADCLSARSDALDAAEQTAADRSAITAHASAVETARAFISDALADLNLVLATPTATGLMSGADKAKLDATDARFTALESLEAEDERIALAIAYAGGR